MMVQARGCKAVECWRQKGKGKRCESNAELASNLCWVHQKAKANAKRARPLAVEP
jgi:hypothetical protein